MPGAASHAVPDLFPVPLGWWAFPKGTAMHTAHDLTIRWQINRDNKEIICIDERCYLEPLIYSDLIDMLKDRNVIGIVAEDRGHVLGYVIYRLDRKSVV